MKRTEPDSGYPRLPPVAYLQHGSIALWPAATPATHPTPPPAPNLVAQSRHLVSGMLPVLPRETSFAFTSKPDILQRVAHAATDGLHLLAWTSLNRNHLSALSETRHRLLLRGLMHRYMRCASPASQPLQDFDLQLLETAVRLRRYVRDLPEPLQSPPGIDLRQRGAAALGDALWWLDGMTVALETTQLGKSPDPFDAACQLRLSLQNFWTRLPAHLVSLADDLCSPPHDVYSAQFFESLLKLLGSRVRWHSGDLKAALPSIHYLVERAPGLVQEQASLRFRQHLLAQRCYPGYLKTGDPRIQRLLTWIDAMPREQVAPFLLNMMEACVQVDATAGLAEQQSDPTGDFRAQRQLSSEMPEHHCTMNVVDLLLFYVRGELPASAIAAVTKPLHVLLLSEIRSLTQDLEQLPAGTPQENLKCLLTAAVTHWSGINFMAHTPGKASESMGCPYQDSGIWITFEERVQRLCSVMRNLYHVICTDKRSIASLELRGRLRELFSSWPTKPGKNALLRWLED